MANRNFPNSRIYTGHVMPVLLDCNFVVDSTNGNGLGIRSLKGPYIKSVRMHTTASLPPGIVTNPAATGVIFVTLADNYNRYYGGFSGQVAPIGASGASTTANTAYVITSLGTATSAQWVAAGLPARYTPAVGTAFIAMATGTIGGGATVAPISATGSGIDHIEIVGDPNQTLAPSDGQGGHIIMQCFLGNTETAPANGTVISLAMYFSNSSVLNGGE
jgi:hypothetical protein